MNVKFEHVYVTYGKKHAIDNVSFELNGPKIYGLLGRNGAGKTSLLSTLASFREPSQGAITVNGENPFENAEVMQQIAFLYNKDYSGESSKLKDMINDTKVYRPHFDSEYADYLTNRFGLDKKKAMKKMSKGMQSAVNVIIGLASHTPITIFDEVYLGMDAPSREIFYEELLKEQERHPRIFILSTHLVSEMEYLFDEVIIIKNGKLLLQEEYDSLVSKGATITGNEEQVDEFIMSKEKLHEQLLGKTKAVMVYGELQEEEIQRANSLGLDVSPISLHELFVHLTKEREV